MAGTSDIKEKLKRGYLEMIILQLLSEEDMYGYQLKTEILERSNNLLDLTEGVLYPPLYRMIEKELISERKETVGKRRVRVYYHIEDSGKAFLEYLKSEYKKAMEGVCRVMKWGESNE